MLEYQPPAEVLSVETDASIYTDSVQPIGRTKHVRRDDMSRDDGRPQIQSDPEGGIPSGSWRFLGG
jgi:hypothetical protein